MPAAVPGIWSSRCTLLDAARGGSARLLPAVGIAARAATVANPSVASSRLVRGPWFFMTFPLFVALRPAGRCTSQSLPELLFFEPDCGGGRPGALPERALAI